MILKLTKVTNVQRVASFSAEGGFCDDEDDGDFLDIVEEDSDSETIYVEGFKDLIRVLKSEGVIHASCSPATGSTSEWVSSEPYQDPYTGDTTTVSIHWDESNPARAAKYWRLAFICLGLVH